MAYYFGNLNKLVGEQNKAQAPQSQTSVGAAPVNSGGSASNIERGSGTIQNAGAMLEANKGLNQSNITQALAQPGQNEGAKNISQSQSDTADWMETNKLMPAITDFSKATDKTLTDVSGRTLPKTTAEYVTPYKTTANLNMQRNPGMTATGGLSTLLGNQFGSKAYTSGEKGMDAALLGQAGGLQSLLGSQGKTNIALLEEVIKGKLERGAAASSLQEAQRQTKDAATKEIGTRADKVISDKAAADKAAADKAEADRVANIKSMKDEYNTLMGGTGIHTAEGNARAIELAKLLGLPPPPINISKGMNYPIPASPAVLNKKEDKPIQDKPIREKFTKGRLGEN